MKIAIIGAGWYGCHLGATLLQSGHDVQIFEKSSSSISGASKRNQNRLHLGFHYPRDHETRVQSKEGFEWFIEHYEQLTRKIDNNFYCVPNQGSTIDFDTYKIIMSGTKLDFDVCKSSDIQTSFGIESMQGYIKCNERVVRNDLASNYFNNILSQNIKFNTYVDLTNTIVLEALESNYDHIIDCTWGASGIIEDVDYYYEPCIYFYYKNDKGTEFALTIMDGKFYSLYPYYEDIYTLTSVEHTPIGVYEELSEALLHLNKAKQDKSLIADKRLKFENEFQKYYPNFLKDFSFYDVEFSMKTKMVSSTDYRGCFIKKKGKIISVFSGKIDTLHIAEKEVVSTINNL